MGDQVPDRPAKVGAPGAGPVHWPEEFLRRMEALLGDEFPAFLDALSRPRARGLRINPAKVGAVELADLLRLELAPVPWSGLGFSFQAAGGLGEHPAHRAGLFYLQDPAAMSVVEVMDPAPDWKVVDLAAAPGGKTTHLLSRLGGEGLVLANDVTGPRLRGLHENLDRWGAASVVTSGLELDELATYAPATFDAALLDAPCSSEALFRRDPAVASQWSPAAVAGAARRQRRLLALGARLVRPGGVLVYSTCTFEVEEDEKQVAAFLEDHPDWELMEAVRRPGFDSGVRLPPWPTERTVRLWPHHVVGDGQFAARFRRRDEPAPVRPTSTRGRGARRSRSAEQERADLAAERQAVRAWEEFVAETCPYLELPPGRPLARGSHVYHLPAPAERLPPRHLFRPGMPLGIARPGRFQPSQALACCLDPDAVSNRVCWPGEEDELDRFLRGETVDSPGRDGWVLVCYQRWGIGWGRRTQGVIKNFLPHPLRRR
jgi:16S rRNA C967 or C1407 C5-methylase (RsmB/RsmF family)/NOL1/NOP2/fmu family ribosome biogenesis protein